MLGACAIFLSNTAPHQPLKLPSHFCLFGKHAHCSLYSTHTSNPMSSCCRPIRTAVHSAPHKSPFPLLAGPSPHRAAPRHFTLHSTPTPLHQNSVATVCPRPTRQVPLGPNSCPMKLQKHHSPVRPTFPRLLTIEAVCPQRPSLPACMPSLLLLPIVHAPSTLTCAPPAVRPQPTPCLL
jgi:hypothetical protein